ncbi:MAG: TIGR03936 family radical SAM-associated protein [Clostridia bacterium]|nr:TIGR03936 family radical SAM-associated protein [Clostridia bacterium]
MVQMILENAPVPDVLTVRVKFHKTGSLQYVSHLDLVRTVTKVLKRAKVPLKYSEGFNPHPRIAFSAPMSVGLESVAEYMDIRLSKMVDCDAMTAALRACLTPELYVERVDYPKTKLTDIALASYEIRIRTTGADVRLAEQCDEALHAPRIVVFKRSKSGDKDTDVSSGIKEVKTSFENGEIVVRTLLYADNARFLNPEYLLDYLKKTCGVLNGNLLTERYSVYRREVFFEDGRTFS